MMILNTKMPKSQPFTSRGECLEKLEFSEWAPKGPCSEEMEGAGDSRMQVYPVAFSGGKGVSCWDIPLHSVATVTAHTSGHGAGACPALGCPGPSILEHIWGSPPCTELRGQSQEELTLWWCLKSPPRTQLGMFPSKQNTLPNHPNERKATGRTRKCPIHAIETDWKYPCSSYVRLCLLHAAEPRMLTCVPKDQAPTDTVST